MILKLSYEKMKEERKRERERERENDLEIETIIVVGTSTCCSFIRLKIIGLIYF